MKITKDIWILLTEYDDLGQIEIVLYKDNINNYKPYVYYTNGENACLKKMDENDFLYFLKIDIKKNSEFKFAIVGDCDIIKYEIYLGKNSEDCRLLSNEKFVEPLVKENIDIKKDTFLNPIEPAVNNTNILEEYKQKIEEDKLIEENDNNDNFPKNEYMSFQNIIDTIDNFNFSFESSEKVFTNDNAHVFENESDINTEKTETIEIIDEQIIDTELDEKSLIVQTDKSLRKHNRKRLRFGYKLNKKIKIALMKAYRLMPNFIKGDYRRRINL